MRAAKEGDLVKACLELLTIRGVFAWRNNTTGVFDPAKQVFRKFTGLKGVADILGLIPCQHGRLIAVETKMPAGRLRPDQKLFLERVAASGGLALMVRDVAALDAALQQEGIVP